MNVELEKRENLKDRKFIWLLNQPSKNYHNLTPLNRLECKIRKVKVVI